MSAPEPGFGTADLRISLSHVFWIGGGPGAGKSTIARRLSQRYGLHLYDTDAAMPDHARRSTPADAPFLAAFAAMDLDERWLTRSPRTMFETFHWFRGEGFGFIVEDLLALPKEHRIIVEGFRLLPHLVHPLLATSAQALWLLPTPEFRRAALEHRGGTWTIAGRTSDPERALRNLAERDRMFVHQVHSDAQRLGLHAIEVDTGTTEDDLLERVAGTFGL